MSNKEMVEHFLKFVWTVDNLPTLQDSNVSCKELIQPFPFYRRPVDHDQALMNASIKLEMWYEY